MTTEATIEYAKLVNHQAVELERRMHEAQASIHIVPMLPPIKGAVWHVSLKDSKGVLLAAERADTIPAALWAACHSAGLTGGLVPPGRGQATAAP